LLQERPLLPIEDPVPHLSSCHSASPSHRGLPIVVQAPPAQPSFRDPARRGTNLRYPALGGLRCATGYLDGSRGQRLPVNAFRSWPRTGGPKDLQGVASRLMIGAPGLCRGDWSYVLAKGKQHRPRVLSLFTGAGGLDLGLEAAGFDTALCVEIDEDARTTLSKNRPHWKLAVPGDIHAVAAEELLEQAELNPREIDLLAGGPPCQPFSKSGYWVRGDSLRLLDPRAATLRAYLQIVRAALPTALLLENVRGLTFDGKDEGLALLRDGLSRINKAKGTSYELSIVHANAAHYGVPQFRERVFLIAHREGLPFVMPKPTHGDGEDVEPYRTAWDALGRTDLSQKQKEELALTGKWAELLPTIPEGENYLWHTPGNSGEPLFGWRTKFWSFLLKLAKNRPSWTIQAVPGPATGPFHWESRLLSATELARLQTFPHSYKIYGSRRSAQRQAGNAVPSALAEVVGLEIRRQLLGHSNVRREATLVPAKRRGCPAPEEPIEVPTKFNYLRGDHEPHPGTGQGPRATQRKKRPRKQLA
jgi:DNA (cytosine-5)-methyltransferase 1